MGGTKVGTLRQTTHSQARDEAGQKMPQGHSRASSAASSAAQFCTVAQQRHKGSHLAGSNFCFYHHVLYESPLALLEGTSRFGLALKEQFRKLAQPRYSGYSGYSRQDTELRLSLLVICLPSLSLRLLPGQFLYIKVVFPI